MMLPINADHSCVLHLAKEFILCQGLYPAYQHELYHIRERHTRHSPAMQHQELDIQLVTMDTITPLNEGIHGLAAIR
jgi:hypothetical protein